MAGRIPACRLVTIEAGHMVHDERPEEFTAAVGEFLAERPAVEDRLTRPRPG